MSINQSTRRALLSVADKTGLVEFAQQLHKAGIALIASGGTARMIGDAGLPVAAVEDLTGFPEILGGRVKTLHPAVHGGILARRTQAHLDELSAHNLAPIDIVVVNLYPFEQTIANPDVTLAEAIEQIDIGGVALLRAAAKNNESVTVVCDPADYTVIATTLTSESGRTAEQRLQLALKAFRHTAAYDTVISGYLENYLNAQKASAPETQPESLPTEIRLDLQQIQLNRYGENPHQQGGLYGYRTADNTTAEPFVQLHGKEMSYNNWLDLDGGWRSAQDFSKPTVSIIKHGNPCGLASADTLAEAYEKALASDPVSAFGSIVSVNRPLNIEMADRLAKLFVEVVAAPAYDEDALARLRKKKNIRILQATNSEEISTQSLSIRSIYGGVLVQTLDESQADMDVSTWQFVSKKQPTSEQIADLAFAWRVARHVKSNAIVFVQDEATVGVGAGQMSRVDSVMLAGHKAGQRSQGAVMASDAFFPFADGIEAAAQHGIVAVVQPGGSVRDDEVIAAVDQLGLVMAFTGTRHFKH
ncbi:MAG: bifunctional phosphoribosylaminoimidazolecarboxamide formyltransferase/IMP cyclohydrolase [Chloroflexota bacterium]